jgi:hypothetical protein
VYMDIYRGSGSNSQRLFFDEIRLAVSLEEVLLPKPPLQSESKNNR